MSDQNNPLVAFSEAMADAVAKAGQVTVMVNARRRIPASGVVFAPGLAITANHVVERDTDLKVLFANGDETEAELAGRDPSSDLAVLRLDTEKAAVAELNTAEVKVGQIVLALGRPSPNGIEASLGAVSAIGGPVRTRRGGLLESYLRTDTIPYPGFSGGPLVSAAGHIIGINTSGLTPGSAITIPSGGAWKIGKSLAEHGHMRRGYLGVRSQPVELPEDAAQKLGRSQQNGLLLVGIEKDSPASKGGLIVGDILVGIDGSPVNDPDELLSLLSEDTAGKSTPVEVLRGGERMVVDITIGQRK